MPSFGDLVPVADASAFIFSGSIALSGSPVTPVDATTAVVSVDDVIKAPPGLRGLSGSDVRVRLLHPLAAGRYIFFADPLAVGSGIAVKERAHFDATADAKEAAVAAVERGFAARVGLRVQTAFLVALGTIGAVRPLLAPGQTLNGVPWALAPLEIERLLKGRGKPRHVPLVGPLYASKQLPRTPPLRAGLRAILILHKPPGEAIELLTEDERQAAAFIQDTSDVQPPERLETIAEMTRRPE
jgi:hypothetical protein